MGGRDAGVSVAHWRAGCPKYVSQTLRPFQILVGPNGSGKSTALDVVRFLGEVLTSGLEATIDHRTRNLQDLVWRRETGPFELAVETSIPGERRELLEQPAWDTCRYELQVGVNPATGEDSILEERVWLLKAEPIAESRPELFPHALVPPPTILLRVGKGRKKIVHKLLGKNDNFHDETGKGWDHSFKLGPRKSALANLPDDETRFPISTWLKRLLSDGIENLTLNGAAMRGASPPGQPRGFRPSGSNLPWVLEDLRRSGDGRYERWLQHVRTAIPGIQEVKTIERPEDRHRYLQVVYATGLEAPSWKVSDGTLRLLALTMAAYAGNQDRVWLIEEPENGIHPKAVEAVYQSLSSTYGAQILCATHSPIILSLADPRDLLCFALTSEGATDIVSGDLHPQLSDWRREADLGTLFAAGVLG